MKEEKILTTLLSYFYTCVMMHMHTQYTLTDVYTHSIIINNF